ncbi:hypothetical protein KIH74_23660 [Kineosporia sp. J2-2]|uniref:Uncharacterized protein n=1 Tax=Kineosporia corallincola TaxID=2835133 RepID=A0ABS5TNJ5_9ACTN|nr:hypothetical protein [Kineosporia corallincola]MBT0771959.1 hypothetical protein [Kineosporia corallincola]
MVVALMKRTTRQGHYVTVSVDGGRSRDVPVQGERPVAERINAIVSRELASVGSLLDLTDQLEKPVNRNLPPGAPPGGPGH